MPTGRWVVYVDTDGVSAVPWNEKGKPRVLGKPLLFAPSATPGHVWLEYGAFGPGPVRVRLVSIGNRRAAPAITLPAGAQLIAGTDAGLLLSAHGGLQLWNPGTPPRPLPDSSSAQGFDVSAQLVAYDTGCANKVTGQNLSYEPGAGYSACQMLRVYNVLTGRLLSFATPAGTRGWVPSHYGFVNLSAIAPSGTKLAAEAVSRPVSQGTVQVFVLRLAGGSHRPTAVPSSTAFVWAATAWSATGSWLFYQGRSSHLWAYQVTTGRVRSSTTPCCRYAVMASINSIQR
jgi:hypothetical protein